MKTEFIQNDDKLTVLMEGSLDTMTSPDFENDLKARCEGISELTLDFSAVHFLSSAGIRVILWVHKKMGGHLILKNVSDDIQEVFSLTGLKSVLNFE